MSNENPHVTKVQKVGNSLAFYLPRPLCDAYQIARGDSVIYVAIDEMTLGIRKVPDDFYKTLTTP